MRYLLDTNIISALLANEPTALYHARTLNADDLVYVPSAARAEHYAGILHMPTSRRRALIEERADRLFARYRTLRVPKGGWRLFGDMRRRTRKSGRTVGDNDLWIAATAILLDATLVTRDRDFDAIDDVRRVDWSITAP